MYCTILCFVNRASLYNLVNKTNLVHSFSFMFISILYMFRETMFPSSGEITVLMRHLVFVTLCGWPSGMQDGTKLISVSSHPAYQTVICTEWQIPSFALVQLFLPMMGT